MKPGGIINSAAVRELAELCGRRLYVFVADAADRGRELESLLTRSNSGGLELTIVTAERINEWNVSWQSINAYVSDAYELRYLTA